MLAFLARLVLAGAAATVLGAAFGRFHPALDALGVWLLYGIAAALAVAIGSAVMRRRIVATTALAVSVGGAMQTTPFVDWSGSGSPGSVRLLQHNLNFRNEASDLLQRIDAIDFVAVQEVNAATKTLGSLPPAWSGKTCPFTALGGVAVLTRLPVTTSGCLNGGAWIRSLTREGPVTVVSLHLHWPWPYGQAAQVSELLPYLEALPRPVIVAGDFNQTPWSDSVARIGAATGTAPLPGLGATLAFQSGLLRINIDHILVPPEWTGTFVRDGRHGSDHAALSARIGLR